MHVESLDVPVVSVGNLTSGGTGKTPMVAWLVGAVARRGLRPGVLARGYGRSSKTAAVADLNDEGLLLKRELPGLLQVQDPDRVRGGRKLVGRGAEVVILDDGFQHRRLARNLDLCLVDATRPWGLPAEKGAAPVCAFLPRGLMREPRSGLARADALVITRTGLASEETVAELKLELQRHAPGKPVLLAKHRARELRDPRGRKRPLGELEGRAVDLVSAIGNPDAFEASVKGLGAEVVTHRSFPDHHVYVPGDLDGLGDERWLLATAKDAVKLGPLGKPFQALEIELDLVEGHDVLDALLEAAIAPPGTERRSATGAARG
jgi:tetraacyldisaccharide 4'-kinase